MKLHYEGVELCLRQTGAAATGQGPLTLEFGGLRVTVERSDGVSTIAGGRVEHLPGIRTFVLTLPDGRVLVAVGDCIRVLGGPAVQQPLVAPVPALAALRHAMSALMF